MPMWAVPGEELPFLLEQVRYLSEQSVSSSFCAWHSNNGCTGGLPLASPSCTGALANDKKFEEAVQQLQRYETKAGKSEALGSVELQLLIGKVYSQWDRHFASALAVYDGLIEKYPEDFRYPSTTFPFPCKLELRFCTHTLLDF